MRRLSGGIDPVLFVRILSANRGKVCATCGLEMLGHRPESTWLGFAPHPFDPVDASGEELIRAQQLTAEAYRRRP